MSTQKELKVTERDTTLNPRQLRAAGFVPATIYGKNVEPRSVQVRAHELSQFYTQGVREFKLSGFLETSVRIQELQMEPVSTKPLSVQFLQLDGASDSGKASRKVAKAEKPAEETPAAEAVEPEAETVLA